VAGCAGQRLRIRLESPVGTAPLGATALLYPCYYDGGWATLEGESLGERCLGVELNAASTRLAAGSLLAAIRDVDKTR